MLSLPEFDTYHILSRYAADPASAKNVSALRMLKRVALRQLQWRVLNCRIATPTNVEQLFNMVLGRDVEIKQGPKTNMLEMNETELMDMYNKALASVGLSVDPEALAKAQQQQ